MHRLVGVRVAHVLRPAVSAVRRVTTPVCGVRNFATAPAADKPKAGGDAPKAAAAAPKPVIDPAVVAAAKASKAAAKTAKAKAKLDAVTGAGGGAGVNPERKYLGRRATVDTERTIDTVRYKLQLSEIRARYAAEYAEKKAAYDQQQMLAVQNMLVDKAERLTLRRTAQREAREQFERNEAVRLKDKQSRTKFSNNIRLDRERAALNRRKFQLEQLRAEVKSNTWINQFDQQITEMMFEGQAAPHGFWPEYSSSRSTTWENVVSFDPYAQKGWNRRGSGAGPRADRDRESPATAAPAAAAAEDAQVLADAEGK